jgi:hypothetical protein
VVELGFQGGIKMSDKPEIITDEERNPLQSKKFLSFLTSEITWKILAGLVLFWGRDAMDESTFVIMLAIVLVAGFVETGFILGQASLDKFVRLAKIASLNGGKSPTKLKDLIEDKKEPGKPG